MADEELLWPENREYMDDFVSTMEMSFGHRNAGILKLPFESEILAEIFEAQARGITAEEHFKIPANELALRMEKELPVKTKVFRIMTGTITPLIFILLYFTGWVSRYVFYMGAAWLGASVLYFAVSRILWRFSRRKRGGISLALIILWLIICLYLLYN